MPAGITPQNPQDQLMLVGYSIESCISLSLAAIQFKFRQDELYSKLRYDKVAEKVHIMEAQYKKKIAQMNHGYSEMQQNLSKVHQERRDLESDVKELREKYGQKAKEAHNLRQLLGQHQPSIPSGLPHVPVVQTQSGAMVPYISQQQQQQQQQQQHRADPQSKGVNRSLDRTYSGHAGGSGLAQYQPSNHLHIASGRQSPSVIHRYRYSSPFGGKGGVYDSPMDLMHRPSPRGKSPRHGIISSPGQRMTPSKRQGPDTSYGSILQASTQPSLPTLGLPQCASAGQHHGALSKPLP